MLDLKCFAEQQNCLALGLEEVTGGHRIYVKDGVREMLNFQNVKGKAKPYQVKQFLKIIGRYKLLEE